MLALAKALEVGWLAPPFRAIALADLVPTPLSRKVAQELQHLLEQGMQPGHMAYTLHLLAAERATSQQLRDRVELVWTGKKLMGSAIRDTSVVVSELLSAAKQSVLISTYAVDRNEKARAIFTVLAERMETLPDLQVCLFINIKRPFTNKTPDSELLRAFAEDFRKEIWPGSRLPTVLYYPPALEIGGLERTCLHAKCIVVDDEQVLITSANFTEAAHERNIETGVLFTDPAIAQAVRQQFETLLTHNIFMPVPGLG